MKKERNVIREITVIKHELSALGVNKLLAQQFFTADITRSVKTFGKFCGPFNFVSRSFVGYVCVRDRGKLGEIYGLRHVAKTFSWFANLCTAF